MNFQWKREKRCTPRDPIEISKLKKEENLTNIQTEKTGCL